MIYHENRLLADDSHEISCLIFFKNLDRSFITCICICLAVELNSGIYNRGLSSAVVISALKVNVL